VLAIQQLTTQKQRQQSPVSLDTRPPLAECRTGAATRVQARAFSVLLRPNDRQRTQPHGKVTLEPPVGGNGINAANNFPLRHDIMKKSQTAAIAD